MDINLSLKVENIVAKGAILSNFFFCHHVFKNLSAAGVRKRLYEEKGSPFPKYNKSLADDFENVLAKV